MKIEKGIKSFGKFSRNIAIGLAIVILTIFVSVYGINTFYEKPEYENFCEDRIMGEIINTAERCEEIGGKWSFYEYEQPKPVIEDDSIIIRDGYCDRDYACRQNYDEAMKTYSRNVFIIAIPLGIMILFLGAFVFSLDAVGVGLMLGGIGTLIYGAGGYWRYSENWLRFLISLTGLVALIWFAYWFNKRMEKN